MTGPLLPAAGLRLLLAEDSPVNQEVGTEMLRELGYSVDVAADGREAVAAFRHTLKRKFTTSPSCIT